MPPQILSCWSFAATPSAFIVYSAGRGFQELHDVGYVLRTERQFFRTRHEARAQRPSSGNAVNDNRMLLPDGVPQDEHIVVFGEHKSELHGPVLHGNLEGRVAMCNSVTRMDNRIYEAFIAELIAHLCEIRSHIPTNPSSPMTNGTLRIEKRLSLFSLSRL